MVGICDTRQHDYRDEHLPTLLYAYQSTIQESTWESPFFLLYDRDPRILISTVLSQSWSVYNIDSDDYLAELVIQLAESCKLAQASIEQAQESRKELTARTSEKHNGSLGNELGCICPVIAESRTQGGTPFSWTISCYQCDPD